MFLQNTDALAVVDSVSTLEIVTPLGTASLVATKVHFFFYKTSGILGQNMITEVFYEPYQIINTLLSHLTIEN